MLENERLKGPAALGAKDFLSRCDAGVVRGSPSLLPMPHRATGSHSYHQQVQIGSVGSVHSGRHHALYETQKTTSLAMLACNLQVGGLGFKHYFLSHLTYTFQI